MSRRIVSCVGRDVGVVIKHFDGTNLMHMTKCAQKALSHVRKNVVISFWKNTIFSSLFGSFHNLVCFLTSGHMFRRNKMQIHMETNCSMRIVRCDECKIEMTRGDLPMHKKQDCPERTQKCAFFAFGCKTKLKHYDLKQHLVDFMSEHMQLLTMKV